MKENFGPLARNTDVVAQCSHPPVSDPDPLLSPVSETTANSSSLANQADATKLASSMGLACCLNDVKSSQEGVRP